MTAYDRDLAYIHDSGFTDFARKAAPGLLRLLAQNRIATGLVVDAGCGSGVWAAELCRRGYQVLGLDISPHMIRLARQCATHATFRTGSFLTAELPECYAVTAIGECVNYAFDPRSGKAGLAGFFRRVYTSLRPGGLLIFDIVEPGVTEYAPPRKFVEGPDWTVLVDVQEDRKKRILTRRIVTFRRAGKLFRRSEETHRLHLYRSADVLRELDRAGFRARQLTGYGQFRFAPAHAGFVARKPWGRTRVLRPASTPASIGTT